MDGGLLSGGQEEWVGGIGGCWQPDKIVAFKSALGAEVGRCVSGSTIRDEDR